MKRVLSLFATFAAAVVAALSIAAPSVAADSHALIQGSGSSWAANAINQWVADVANNGMQVVFTANGAAQGRKDFAFPAKATDFGVSDIGYQGTDPETGQADTAGGRGYAYLPIAAGGTAFPYHIEVGGQKVENLRLSGETVAKIFTNQITNWNDPAITKDNNGHALPSIPIIPVVHSEGAGVTYEFTRYLAKEFPSIWGPCNGGKDIATEYFPLNCGKSAGPQKSQSGSDGVMNFIKQPSANGSIAVEEYSYPLLAGYPSAKLLNAAGYYTLPTQYNVAVALTKAQINMDASSKDYLLQNLDNVYTNADRRTYPLSSYVYAIIPTASDDPRETTAKRQTVEDFLYYSICQGQSEIGPIGYSSLPVNLVSAGFTQLAKLKTADAGVDVSSRDITTCHNPTFIAGQPNVNHLAQIAPNPPACDKQGVGPCAAGVGAYNGSSPTDAKNASSATGSTGGTGAKTAPGTTTPAGGGSAAAPGAGGSTGGAPGVTAPGQSDVAAAAGTTAQVAAGADPTTTVVPTTLAADAHAGPSRLLTGVVVALLLAALGAPVLTTLLWPRRRSGR